MHQIKQTQIIVEMLDIVKEYDKDGDKMSPILLINLQDKLTAKSVYFTSEVAQAIYNADNAELDRKVGIAQSIEAYVSEGQTVTASKEMAIRDQRDKRDTENQNIAQSVYYKQMMAQINKVLSSMQQRISYIKIEYQKAKVIENKF